MLKGIPPILPPDLLKILCEMGHGDRIVLADGNFPAWPGKNLPVVRMDGHGIPDILEAVLALMPLDSYVGQPVTLMQVMAGDPVETPIWDEYGEIIGRHDPRGASAMGHIDRFAFYQEAQQAYAVVTTGEKALYANIILQKGVVAM